MPDWSASVPALFAPQFIEYASAEIRFEVGTPPAELVSRIHTVALHDGEVVVCCSDNGWRFLPGGTREPGETPEQSLDRELLEEAGARRVGGWSYLGAFRADHTHERPYRPHLPHPLGYWAIGVAKVELVGPPTNPPDGEQVTQVRTFRAADAIDFLDAHDPLHANVVRLAVAMGLV